MTSSALEDRVRKAPNVAEAGGETDAGQQEFETGVPRLRLVADAMPVSVPVPFPLVRLRVIVIAAAALGRIVLVRRHLLAVQRVHRFSVHAAEHKHTRITWYNRQRNHMEDGP